MAIEKTSEGKKMKVFGLCGLLAIMLAPLVSGQERVNQTAPVTAARQAEAPFAAEIAAFEAADKKNPPPSRGIVFVGSSSIRFWTTLALDFPGLPVINRGFGGSEIADSVRYADRIVLPYKPKMIVFYAGTNDINAGKSPTQVLKRFSGFCGKGPYRPAENAPCLRLHQSERGAVEAGRENGGGKSSDPALH